MNLATVIVLLIVLGMMILAIHALCQGKGSCSCERGGKDKKTGGCSSCASCDANCPLKGR